MFDAKPQMQSLMKLEGFEKWKTIKVLSKQESVHEADANLVTAFAEIALGNIREAERSTC